MPNFYSAIGGKSHIYTKQKKNLQISKFCTNLLYSKKYIIMLIVEMEIERIIHTFSVLLAYVCLHSHKKQNKIRKYWKVLFAY